MRRAYRGDASAVAPVAPVAPSLGFPSEGDAANNVLATLLGEFWVHMVTEGFVTVIEQAGLVPGDDPTQFRDALVSLIPGGQDLSTYATRVWVTQQVNDLLDSAPGALNTLNELAAALGDDANFSATVNAAIASRLLRSGGTMTGALNLVTPPANDVTKKAANTEWVNNRLEGLAVIPQKFLFYDSTMAGIDVTFDDVGTALALSESLAGIRLIQIFARNSHTSSNTSGPVTSVPLAVGALGSVVGSELRIQLSPSAAAGEGSNFTLWSPNVNEIRVRKREVGGFFAVHAIIGWGS